MYLKCALFFPLGWKFCVSNVLWNWSLRLETRPELQFKRSKITPRKRHLFVPRSGSLQFFPFIFTTYLCLVLLQVPKCFGLVQFFCARPKLYLHIVVVTNILCQTKRWFAFSKIGFCAGTTVFEEALNAVKFLGWLKKFGPAQNILEPVKGQGIIPFSNPLDRFFK